MGDSPVSDGERIAAAIRDGLSAVADAIRATIPPPPAPLEVAPAFVMPPQVVQACEQYGYGDRDEIARNFEVARVALESGASPADAVKAVRAGGRRRAA